MLCPSINEIGLLLMLIRPSTKKPGIEYIIRLFDILNYVFLFFPFIWIYFMTLLFGTFTLVKVFDIVNSSIYIVSFTENQ